MPRERKLGGPRSVEYRMSPGDHNFVGFNKIPTGWIMFSQRYIPVRARWLIIELESHTRVQHTPLFPLGPPSTPRQWRLFVASLSYREILFLTIPPFLSVIFPTSCPLLSDRGKTTASYQISPSKLLGLRFDAWNNLNILLREMYYYHGEELE